MMKCNLFSQLTALNFSSDQIRLAFKITLEDKNEIASYEESIHLTDVGRWE